MLLPYLWVSVSSEAINMNLYQKRTSHRNHLGHILSWLHFFNVLVEILRWGQGAVWIETRHWTGKLHTAGRAHTAIQARPRHSQSLAALKPAPIPTTLSGLFYPES